MDRRPFLLRVARRLLCEGEWCNPHCQTVPALAAGLPGQGASDRLALGAGATGGGQRSAAATRLRRPAQRRLSQRGRRRSPRGARRAYPGAADAAPLRWAQHRPEPHVSRGRGRRAGAYFSTDLPHDDEESLRRHCAGLTGVAERLPNVGFASMHDRTAPTPIGRRDMLFSTPWWTAQYAQHMLGRTRRDAFFYMIQDFEPGSARNSPRCVRSSPGRGAASPDAPPPLSGP
jgi:hypothetical protein